jgi:hypothetical protein
MAKKLGTLLGRLGRRQAKQAESAGDRPVATDPMALDDAPLAVPVLMPAVIFRQLIFDGAEATPVWARPRPAAEPATAGTQAGPADAAKPAQRTRRPKPPGPAGTTRPRTKRGARKDPGAVDR